MNSKHLFFAVCIVLLVFASAEFASAHFVKNAIKWMDKHIDEAHIKYSSNGYSGSINYYGRGGNYYAPAYRVREPLNYYYVPQQPRYYGTARHYNPSTYYVYSSDGYYSGLVLNYD